MQSSDAAERKFFSDVLEAKLGNYASEAEDTFRINGWTSATLEMVADNAGNNNRLMSPALVKFRDRFIFHRYASCP